VNDVKREEPDRSHKRFIGAHYAFNFSDLGLHLRQKFCDVRFSLRKTL
jgi:hypothetical protein